MNTNTKMPVLGKETSVLLHLMPVYKSDIDLTGHSWHGKHFGVTQKEGKERVPVAALFCQGLRKNISLLGKRQSNAYGLPWCLFYPQPTTGSTHG